MTLIRDDRIVETTTSTGTGPITLAGAVAGYRAFSTACVDGDTFYAVIEGVDANGVATGEWEDGLYTYNLAANTITRTTVQKSSNANAAVNFSVGTKRVSIQMTSAAIAALSTGGSGATASPYQASAKLWRLRAPYDSASYSGTNQFASIGEVQFKDGVGTVLTSGGAAIAGSWFNATFVPSTAFDGVLPAGDSGWISRDGAVPNGLYSEADAWLGYKSPANITPTQFTIYPHANYPNQWPSKLVVEFSLDDGNSWTPVGKISTAAPVVGTGQTFAIPQYNPAASVLVAASSNIFAACVYQPGSGTIIHGTNVASVVKLGTALYKFIFTTPAVDAKSYVPSCVGHYNIQSGDATIQFQLQRNSSVVGVDGPVTAAYCIMQGNPSTYDADTVYFSALSPTSVSVSSAPWYLANKPTAASMTLISGDATNLTLTDDPDVGLTFDGGAPVAGDKFRVAERTITSPSANWTFTVRLDAFNTTQNYSGYCIYARDSVGGKIVKVGVDQSGGIDVSRFAALGGTYVSTVASVTLTGLRPNWFRISFNAATTTLSFFASVDGKVWTLFTTETVAAYLGANPTRVGFGVHQNRTTGPNIVGSVGYLTLA